MRYAFRTLFKTPFVTSVAIVSLGLGIGANTAIYSLFDQVLLRPLPVTAAGALVNFSSPGPQPGSNSCNESGNCEEVFSYAMMRDLQRDSPGLTGVAGHRIFGVNLTYRTATISADGAMVSGSYFPVLGLKPALGRLIDPSDDKMIGDTRVVVLGYEYWRTHCGQDPRVIGDSLLVNGQSLTIVGVAPEGFLGTTLGAKPAVYLPITLRAIVQPPFKGFDDRRAHWVYVFGRLSPNTTIQHAQDAMNLRYHALINDVDAPLQKGMSARTLERFKARRLLLAPGAQGQSSVHKQARTPLSLLFAVTGVVLLIACANIANLLLARSAARAGEMAIRLSIGANRGRLIGQLLLESCLLAIMGGVAGLVFAQGTLKIVISLLHGYGGESLHATIDSSMLLFALAISIGTGLLFGLFPALHSTRPDLASTLKGIAGQPGGGRSAAWFRRTLVTTQITLSMALLGCAGLFIKSLVQISRVDLGLRTDNVVTFQLFPRQSGYSPERSLDLFRRVEEALKSQPGVTGATLAVVPMLSGSNWGRGVSVDGFQGGPDVDNDANTNEIGPGYFHTLGIPLVQGREFTAADAIGAEKVAIVNEAFAKKFNLGRHAVGKRMAANDATLDTQIVGVVKDTAYSEVKGVVPPVFVRPYRQDEQLGNATFYVTTNLDPTRLVAATPKLMAQIDPNLPVDSLRTLPDQVNQNIAVDRLIMTLAAAFAIVATVLAAVGLYGVLSYTVSQRTREFGLRMALGATPERVRRLVLRQVLWMTAVGGAIGLGLALALGRSAESLLFQMKGSDPAVLIGAGVLLALVALSAGVVPAIRASRIEPMKALRYE